MTSQHHRQNNKKMALNSKLDWLIHDCNRISKFVCMIEQSNKIRHKKKANKR